MIATTRLNLKFQWELNTPMGSTRILSSVKKKYVRLENLTESDVKITVYLLRDDCGPKKFKKCSFKTYYDNSWIVFNEHVFRQKYGGELNELDPTASSYRMESYSEDNDKVKHCSLEKFDPLQASIESSSNTAAIPDEVDRSLATKEPSSTTDLHIYNDSHSIVKLEVPYAVQSGSRRFKDCKIGKRDFIFFDRCTAEIVKFTVYLLKDDGKEFKKCTFKTHKNYSWIVTDDYVYRHKEGSDWDVVADDLAMESSSRNDHEVMRYTLETVNPPQVNIYNKSSYIVQFDVQYGLHSDTGSIKNCKIKRGKYVRLEDCTADDLEITVHVLKDGGGEFKKCTFKSGKDHSWIVTNRYVCRQKPGSDLRVEVDKLEDFAEGMYFGHWSNVLRHTLKKVDNPHARKVPGNRQREHSFCNRTAILLLFAIAIVIYLGIICLREYFAHFLKSICYFLQSNIEKKWI